MYNLLDTKCKIMENYERIMKKIDIIGWWKTIKWWSLWKNMRE